MAIKGMVSLAETIAQMADDQTIALTYLHDDGRATRLRRADIARRAHAVGDALARRGVLSGDVILIAHTSTLASIDVFWGVILLGAIPTIFPTLTDKLDPTRYEQGIMTLTQLSAVRAIVTDDDFAPTLQTSVACPVWTWHDLQGDEAWRPSHLPASDSIALLQHSSGTTGLQKGVALQHQAIQRHIEHYSHAIELNRASDVVVSWLPLYHDMGLIAGFLMPLMTGVPLVLMSPFAWVKRPAMLLKAMSDYKGTLCWLPNFAYNHSARRVREGDMPGVNLSHVRAFINCSEPVRHESHRLFLERFAPYGVRDTMLATCYAMAENVFAVTQTPIARPAPTLTLDGHVLRARGRVLATEATSPQARVHVSCGTPIAGVRVRVLDEAGIAQPEGVVGEIAITSTTLLSAYYRRPDLKPIVDGWYPTGDRGFLMAGEVYIIGRYKDLIIHAGRNLYPQDLEAIVHEIEGVHAGRVVAFGVMDADEGTERIAIIAEVDAPTDAERLSITRAIRSRITQEMGVTVTYVHLVDERWLIKTSSGKIARHANREKWLRTIKQDS